MHKNSIKPGQKVVIIDDLMATGGTIEAITKLIERDGRSDCQSSIFNGTGRIRRQKEIEGVDVETVIAYPGK